MRVDRLVIILVFLVVAAGVSWWLSQDGDIRRVAGTQGTGDSDYSFTGLAVSEMDPKGDLLHTLSAEQLYHYPQQELSILARPQFAFYSDSTKTWDIVAEKGTVEEADHSVLFSGDVQIEYAGEVPDQGFKLYTEELRVWPDDRRAETDHAVKIVQQSGEIDSIGMKAEFDSRRLDLLSNVRGTYEP